MACLCDLPQNGIGAKRCSGVIGIKSVYGGKSLGQTVDEGQHLELARLAAEFRQHRIHAACENMVPVLLCMDTGRAAVCMACLLVELVKREVFRLGFSGSRRTCSAWCNLMARRWLRLGVNAFTSTRRGLQAWHGSQRGR